LNAGYIKYIDDQLTKPVVEKSIILDEARKKMRPLIDGVASVHPPVYAINEVLTETIQLLEILLFSSEKPVDKTVPGFAVKKQIATLLHENKSLRYSLIAFTFLARIGKLIDPLDYQNNGISLFDEWKAGQLIQSAILEMGLLPEFAMRVVKMVRVLITLQNWTQKPINQNPGSFIQEALSNTDIQLLLQVNRYKDTLWYSKEGFIDLQNCMILTVVFNPDLSYSSIRFEEIIMAREIIAALKRAGENSDFQIEKLIQSCEEPSAQNL
jgi:hypothetical protein